MSLLPSRDANGLWVFSDTRLPWRPQHILPSAGHSGAGRRRGDQEQRLPGLSLGQDAEQDQRRRQRDLLVCGRGQTRGLGPQDQHLRQLPCRHHLQASRTTTSRPSPPPAPNATRSSRRATGPASTALAAAKGQKGAATCSDCHDGHTILPPTSPASPLHFSRLAETCGGCHDQEAKDVEESVHGKAVAAGHREAPTCTDCHSEHKITGLKSSSTLKISADVCSNCHASERLNTKYNLPPDRVKTFFESYHGLAAQYGSTLAANCASCHGVHSILPSTDPRSSIYKTNLVATCGKCHPGATENFVAEQGARGRRDRAGRRRPWRPDQLVGPPHLPGPDRWHDRFHARPQPAAFREEGARSLPRRRPLRRAHEPLAADAALPPGRQLHHPGRHGLCAEVPGFLDWQAHGLERSVPALEPSHRRRRPPGRRGLPHLLHPDKQGRPPAGQRPLPGHEGPERCHRQRALPDRPERREAARSAASATPRRWNTGRWSGARSSWASPAS